MFEDIIFWVSWGLFALSCLLIAVGLLAVFTSLEDGEDSTITGYLTVMLLAGILFTLLSDKLI